MFVVDSRSEQKHLSQSDLQRRLVDWIHSADGKEWRESREKLFRGDEADLTADGSDVEAPIAEVPQVAH